MNLGFQHHGFSFLFFHKLILWSGENHLTDNNLSFLICEIINNICIVLYVLLGSFTYIPVGMGRFKTFSLMWVQFSSVVVQTILIHFVVFVLLTHWMMEQVWKKPNSVLYRVSVLWEPKKEDHCLT